MVMMKASDYAKLESSKAAEKAALSYQQAQKSQSSSPSAGGSSSYSGSSYSPPPTSYTASAPNYSKPTTPSYTAPASSYTGPAATIGSVNPAATGSDMNKSYDSIYNSVRTTDPTRNQINTWADSKGNVYDTTNMTPQQIFALSLYKDGNPNAAAILSGMGLDMNGNPTSKSSSSSSKSSPTAYSGSSYSSPPTSGGGGVSSSNAGSGSSGYVKNPEIDKLSIDQQLAYYAQNPTEAMNEILRAKNVWNSTTDPAAQQAANDWANQLRSVAGISMDDPTYGNSYASPAAPLSASTSRQSQPQTTSQGQKSYGNYPGIDVAGITGRVTANVNDDIARQIQVYNQQLAAAQQANQLALAQNNQFLAEQTGKMQQQKLTTDEQIKTFQNRRGGFYSGGVDTQMAANTSATNEAVGGLTRDVQARNANIWSQNSMLAQQAAEKVAMLQSQAPNVIRQQIQEEIDRQRGYNQQDAALTGFYNGAPTMQMQSLQFEQNRANKMDNIDLAKWLTETYGIAAQPKSDAGVAFDQVAGVNPLTGRQFETAVQQQKFSDAWKVIDALGYVPDSVADIVGIPAGVKTLDAVNIAAQIAIAQQNANTSAARSSGSSSSSTSVTQQRYDDQQAAYEFEGQIYDEISQLDPGEVNEWLEMNRAEISRQLGTTGFDRVKKSITAPSQQADKQSSDLRKQAIALAKNDPDWYDEAGREQLIQEYMGYLQ